MFPNSFRIDNEDDRCNDDLKLHDWRGRSFEVKTSLKVFKIGMKIHPIGAPSCNYECKEDGSIHLHGIYVPKCLIELEMNGESFTWDKISLSNFVGQEEVAPIHNFWILLLLKISRNSFTNVNLQVSKF